MRYVELYRFASASGQAWRYTSADSAQEFDNWTWAPLAIHRSGIEQGEELARSQLEIEVPISGELGAQALAGRLTLERVDVTVWRLAGAFQAVIWQGAISDMRPQRLAVTLVCRPLAATLRESGRVQRFSRQCRHQLYGAGCGLSRTSFQLQALVSEVVGALLTVPDISHLPSGWYVGGYLEHTSGRRYIRAHSGTQIELVAPLPGLGANQQVTLYAGCDRLRQTCHDKFDNVLRFGGFPWIPEEDPHGSTLR
jgi:uncharacterized phage protein (TIGR02218 family)